jgi:MFS family permease
MKQLDRRWKVLLVTAIAVFMAFLDVTIVNVAFPSIREDFSETSIAGLSWVLNAYNIVFAALLVPAGRLADLLGRRRLFFIGLVGFVVASALCGLAPSVEFLVAARVVQAAAAAMLVPTSLGLLLPEFPVERRASATALWGAVGGVAAATGPSLGGLLIEWADWRLVFFVNLAFGLVAWVPARRLLRETRDPDRGAVPDRRGALVAGNRAGAVVGLGECAGARRLRALGRLVGFVRTALGGASAPGLGALAVPRAVLCRRVRRGLRVRTRLLRRAAVQHPVPDRRLGLFDA